MQFFKKKFQDNFFYLDQAAKMRAKHTHLKTYYHYYTNSGSHTLANFDLDGKIRRPTLMPLR